MSTDEKEIIEYLKGWPYSFISGREICRKIGGKERYAENPSWAIPVLTEMLHKGWLEKDAMGYYRLKPEEDKRKKKEKHPRRHVSPQILNILNSSGKSFEGMEGEQKVEAPPPIPVYPKSKLPDPASSGGQGG